MYLTILMPCLNEEDSIGQCVKEAKEFMQNNNIAGEVLVVDNVSNDKSIERALIAGARVIVCINKGYGNALIHGINHAKGDYIIMGDCDGSYDFSSLDNFMEAFKSNDIVIGNRYTSISDKESLSLIHKLGGILLSAIARMKTRNKVKDFHCGLRGGKTSILRSLNLNTEVFEFATEMLMKADKYDIAQFPIRYRKVTREKCKSKLKPIKDGFRHLIYIWRYKVD